MNRAMLGLLLCAALLLALVGPFLNAAPAQLKPAPLGNIYCQPRPLHPELCQDDPPPGGGGGDPPTPVPTYPPSISASLACAEPGTNGWCRSGAVLNLSASDPQGYGTTLSGDLAGAPFSCAGPNCSQALPAGSGTIHYQATATSGLSSGVGSLSFAFDPVPPVTSLLTTGSFVAGWYITDVTLSASASDATSGLALLEYRLDNGNWLAGDSLTVSAEGLHDIDFRATDNAGLSTTTAHSFKIDKTPPTVSFNMTGTVGANGWYNGPLTLQVQATDALSGLDSVEYRLDNANWISGSQLTLGDGAHTLQARATDKVGNLSAVSVAGLLDLQVDSTAPTLTTALSGQLGLADWYVSDVTATASVSDVTSGIALTEVRLDGDSWQAGSSLTVRTDGLHTVDFRTTDYAGNRTSASRSFKLDATRPFSSFSDPLEGTTQKVAGALLLSGKSTDALSGLAQTEISLDGGASWQLLPQTDGAWVYSWDTAHFSDGLYTILVHADDRAGNRENTARVRIIVGNRPPNVTVQASWWLWEAGRFQVRERQIALRDVTVRISCAPYHPDVVRIYPGDQLPTELKWDRLCGNGAYAAESGDYPVTITACDTFGQCAEALGLIRVPFFALPVLQPVRENVSTPTAAPIPTARPASIQKAAPAPIAQQPAPMPQAKSKIPASPLGVFAMSAFALGFCIVALTDRRPRALHRLAQTLRELE